MAADTEEAAEPDPVRDEFVRSATACFDHVRAVRWGKATANYAVTDGELRIEVDVSVRCFKRATDADPEPCRTKRVGLFQRFFGS